MTTVVVTNIIVALWDREDSLNMAAQRALDAARSRGSLVIPAHQNSCSRSADHRACIVTNHHRNVYVLRGEVRQRYT